MNDDNKKNRDLQELQKDGLTILLHHYLPDLKHSLRSISDSLNSIDRSLKDIKSELKK